MSLDNEKPAKVTRDGNTLVAAYQSASPPLVWKFDLEHNPSFTFVLQGQDGNWELGVNMARGEFHSVARFRSREDAEEAFDATQSGLLKRKASPWRVACMYLIPAVIVLCMLCMLLMRALEQPRMPSRPIPGGSAAANGAMLSQTPPPAPLVPLKEGVPMSADDVLKAPSQ